MSDETDKFAQQLAQIGVSLARIEERQSGYENSLERTEAGLSRLSSQVDAIQVRLTEDYVKQRQLDSMATKAEVQAAQTAADRANNTLTWLGRTVLGAVVLAALATILVVKP